MNNNGSDIKKVALYTRVSTEEQAKSGLSLSSQLEKLQYYSKSKDWEIVGEYVEDGSSGRNIRRPQYQKMMQDMDLWDALVIFKMDRIHRNTVNFTKMMVELKKNRKEFVSMSENYDTSNVMGRFLMDFVQRLAQLESELIGERVTHAMTQKAKDFNAGFVGHKLAKGYKLVKKIVNGEDISEIHEVPKDLELVKTIYNLYADGKPIQEIQKILDLPYGSVRYPLTNIWYVGYEQWGNHFKLLSLDPAISQDLWNIVQTKRCKAPGRSRKFKPFIINELVDSFTLSDEEMDLFGLWNHRIKNKVGN